MGVAVCRPWGNRMFRTPRRVFSRLALDETFQVPDTIMKHGNVPIAVLAVLGRHLSGERLATYSSLLAVRALCSTLYTHLSSGRPRRSHVEQMGLPPSQRDLRTRQGSHAREILWRLARPPLAGGGAILRFDYAVCLTIRKRDVLFGAPVGEEAWSVARGGIPARRLAVSR